MLKPLIKVIKTCLVCFLICLVLAIALEFFNFSHSRLIQEFAIGASCSFIVVIFSSCVQYKAELKKLYSEYVSVTSRLIFTLSLIPDSQEELSERLIEHYYNNLKMDFEEFTKSELALVYFTKRATEKNFQRNNELNKLYLKFEKNGLESHKDAVLATYDKNSIIRAIDEYQNRWPNGFEKDHITMYKDWLLESESEEESEKT